jgi:pimeloyl-ACP methyl ester carboxylesterase/DNA-binding CsgD family transcriptional regulator
MPLRQHVRYLTTSDGARLAWAETGSGSTVVKAANWLTHLEYELQSPVWKHWIDFFSSRNRFVRYDERGCGMSSWQPGALSLEQWSADLETVIDAAQPKGPVTLLGISQGAATCIDYAIRHPERVSQIILWGGYSRGPYMRGTAATESVYKAMIEVARVAWASDNPTFRQMYTSRFIPGGTPEQLRWWNDLCRASTTGEVIASLFEARAMVDISASLARLHIPTLVLHARGDQVVPVDEGRRLASGIPGAMYVELDSRNHVLLEDEPAWALFQEPVRHFMNPREARISAAFSALSSREREVLSRMSEGLSNARIAESLKISEKTVRNHASNLFDKLGVRSRAEAIVFARDRGFIPEDS